MLNVFAVEGEWAPRTQTFVRLAVEALLTSTFGSRASGPRVEALPAEACASCCRGVTAVRGRHRWPCCSRLCCVPVYIDVLLQIHTTLPSAMAGGSTRPSFIVRVISHCAALPPYSPLSLHSSSLHYNQVSLSMHQTLAPDRCGCSLKPRAGAAVCCRCSLFPELTGPGPAFVHPWPSSVGQATVQCSEWSQQAGSWDAPRSGTRHGALSALCG